MQDDIDFKRAMAGVRRLNRENALPDAAQRPSRATLRRQIQQRRIQSSVTRDDDTSPKADALLHPADHGMGHESLSFARPGVQKKVLRDLRKRTKYPIDLTIDLHGMTQLKAQKTIARAIAQIPPGELCNLLIIHGKGLRSPQGARLKRLTADYLRALPAVRAYCSAQPRDGGTGAVYVLVRG